FVTPEHNRSLPTALKNVLDWVSRPYGQSRWPGKPAGIAGASLGATGTAVAQSHLRGVLGYLDVPTLGQPEVYIHFTQGLIDNYYDILNECTRQFLPSLMQRYACWIRCFSAHSRTRISLNPCATLSSTAPTPEPSPPVAPSSAARGTHGPSTNAATPKHRTLI